MSLFDKFPTSVLSLAKSLTDSEQEQLLRSVLDSRSVSDEFPPSLKNFLAEIPPYITDLEYIQNVILTAIFKSINYQGERLSLPLIDEIKLNKEDALPYFLWGLLYEAWTPTKEKDGLSVFIQGYENRGKNEAGLLNNSRKRIYFSAVTPDLYPSKYQPKVVTFFNQLLNAKNANQPLMQIYLDNYFYLYWDLHLGTAPEEIPSYVLEIGHSFNTVLASLKPLDATFYQNYMNVRERRESFKSWITDLVAKIADKINAGDATSLDQTFVYYWLKNSDNGKDPNFRTIDVVFECFHNFVAFSQWGNTIYNIMLKLCPETTDAPEVIKWFQKMMAQGDYDRLDGSAFTPLERFVMELFRVISPNGGSISTIKEARPPALFTRHGYNLTPHKTTSEYFIHWGDPDVFNPDRYKTAPTSDQMNEAKSAQIGFAQCPFHKEDVAVKDGRTDTIITNSIFGTVYSVTDGQSLPVCDYAGYAPFGFGYRRCPGEQFTVDVIKDFLRNVWNNKVQFKKLDITPEQVPVGPGTFVPDEIGFIIG